MRWSYSKLKTWETCPAKYNFSYLQRLPSTGSAASSRGSQMHDELEKYLGEDSYPDWMDPHLEHLLPLSNGLREEEICLDNLWQPCEKDKAAFVAIIDMLCFNKDGTHAMVVDYKSGRRYEDHAQQLHLYALAVMSAYELVERCDVANYYLDEPPGGWLRSHYTRDDLEIGQLLWQDKLETMLKDETFLPRPGRQCRWCDYAASKGGPCPVG